MLFLITTLALQALGLGPAGASPSHAVVAAACAHPNVDASVKNAVAPNLPNDPKLEAVVDVAVTVGPSGKVLSTKVTHSSGNAKIDNAVVRAARESTYSPKIVNCVPVQGGYTFHAEMTPD